MLVPDGYTGPQMSAKAVNFGTEREHFSYLQKEANVSNSEG